MLSQLCVSHSILNWLYLGGREIHKVKFKATLFYSLLLEILIAALYSEDLCERSNDRTMFLFARQVLFSEWFLLTTPKPDLVWFVSSKLLLNKPPVAMFNIS